jgi:adenylate cyclase
MLVREKLTLTLCRMTDIERARDFAMRGDFDRAIDVSERVLRDQADTGEMLFRGPATTVLVEALLRRGSSADLDAARHAVEVLAAVPTDPGFVLHELPILRLRALLAKDSGDDEAYLRYLARFREKALAADFEGYLAQADAMT